MGQLLKQGRSLGIEQKKELFCFDGVKTFRKLASEHSSAGGRQRDSP